MKKVLLLLLIIAFYSFTTSEEIVTVSGKITNTENGTIKIKGELFEKEIKLKPDGSFSENLKIEYDGIYKIETTKNSFQIYLTKDSKLIIYADDANLTPTLKFTGKGNIENQYLAQKQLITSVIDWEFYKLEEDEFLKKLQSIKTSVDNLYAKTKFTDASFKEKEARSIYYLEQIHLFSYKNYHSSNISQKYPKIDETIDLDNNSDFLFSNDYQALVISNFYKNVRDNLPKNTEGDDSVSFITAKDAIPEIKALKSQSIKNRLIEFSAGDIVIDNTNYEKIYEEFLLLTNDPLIKQTLTLNYNFANAIKPGKPSPKFNYENQKGGKTSLEDLKGKYIYIDFWATWCGPCVKEIPFLQKVEEQYKGKNIEFVSISIDAMKDQPKWSKFVTEKQLGGIQLLAENEWNSKIMRDYGIHEVPTFILLDPNGNIVSARAPKPSDPKLIDLFNSLKI
ncbi:Thiol-disulfide isomerase or thioredoxin [Flavobacterium resistens]|uniref:Redoxin domain-containing protein n=1 Tax=Flavobacterium resistens TaxID=443612 RepID=A0A521CVP0_9FLAO|nr:TlpA disulfide reductase family protein [Flavobacterium resistens]MRX67024.1 redoxin domain-containing protein [Flavobacterium resistens]SMO63482.1 Thiol-disulfide isomerase or thioredoxin [Flavobacterium resistens]